MDWKGALVVTGLFHGFACCTARLALAATVLLFYCLSTKAIDEEDEVAKCTDAHKTNSDVGIINHQAGFGVVPRRPKTPKHPPTTHLPHVDGLMSYVVTIVTSFSTEQVVVSNFLCS